MHRYRPMNASSHIGKRWLEISIEIHPVAHEPLSAFLFDLGCSGIVSEDFEDRTLKAYVASTDSREHIRSRIQRFLEDLKDLFPEVHRSHVRIRPVEEEDWSRTWRRFFHTARATSRLTIVPVWEPLPRETNEHLLKIDPGPAFGTGKHPTTRMCLQALERLPTAVPWSLLDVGTGSGILAMYGAKLGAARILALDIDDEALRWAKRNVALNGLSGAVEISNRPIRHVRERFSVVTANLILGDILDLLPDFSRLVAPGGWLILSGLLNEQTTVMEDALRESFFVTEDTLSRDEWTCLLAGKPTSRGKDGG